MAPSLTSLLKASSITDHEELLAAANITLKTSKNDILALRTRIVALLKLDRYDDVLRTIAAGGDELRSQCATEIAYTYYKTGQLYEASKILSTIINRTDAVRHLDGQVAYRAERFDDAWKIYNGFEDTNEDGDLIVNKIAVLAQLGWSGKGSSNYSADPDSIVAFEVAYNLACLYISKGSLLKALQMLQLARRLCDESDELTDEEKQSELVPIVVQQIYIYSRLGLNSEAQELQKLLVLTDDCGEDVKALALVNQAILSLDSSNSAFVTQNKLSAPIKQAEATKLFNFQYSALRQLCLLLDVGIQKFGGVQTLIKQKSKAGPSTAAALNGFAPIGLIASSWSTPAKPLDVARFLFEARPGDVGIALTSIQLCCEKGNISTATSLLETLFKNLEAENNEKSLRARFAPGIVAIAVFLYRHAGRSHLAQLELAKAAQFWKQYPADSARSLLIEAGLELLRSGGDEDLKLAAESFGSLLADTTRDSIASAGVVAAVATVDDQQVQAHLSEIPPVQELTSGSNPQALMDAGIFTSIPLLGTKRSAPESSTPAMLPAKRRRRKKLPTTYDETKQPDPERWLPLRDRTLFKPKGGKKGKKKADALTQGGYVKGEETLALVGGPGAIKLERTISTTPAAVNKKKKKNRK